MIKQLILHELAVAFRVIASEAVVFIVIESDDIGEGQTFLFVATNVFAI